jgi:uncharacterized membrane protein YhhN
MLEILYFITFWGFVVLYIFFESVKADEIRIKTAIILRLSELSALIKGIPSALAVIFVAFIQPSDIVFYLFLFGALLFCFAGDLGMEKGFILGLSLFLIAQILFFITFLYQSIVFNISIESLVIPFLSIIGLSFIMIFFLRYLESSEKGLGKYRIPVIIYCTFISMMLVSTLLLWTTTGIFEVGLIVLGGLLFVISDMIIATKEFHHDISYREIKVMGTYYSAIFLLSLSAIFF